MKKWYSYFILFAFISSYIPVSAQKKTPADGDWSKQFEVLKNTPEAEVMIRVGDIDNLGFGWAEGFNPFSGKDTDAHGYPWEINAKDAGGTDRIFVLSGYKYEEGTANDGYTRNTERPGNLPKPVIISLTELKGVNIKSASLQLFIDDFQSPEYQCKFQFKLNGMRFPAAEKIVNTVSQAGPIGKLVTIKLTDELLQALKVDSLVISIDDAVTNVGDGFAIDFVKLLINPGKVLYKGNISGIVIDEETRQPIKNATVEVKDYGMVKTDEAGKFFLEGVPAGLNIVQGSVAGYSSAQKQLDVITAETTGDVELALKRSGKVVFDNKTLQEGDKLVMKNIQFELASANLTAIGKKELDKLVAFMKQNETVEILLTGHTSLDGSADFNKELSLKRVSSCKNYLATKGVDEGRITVQGFGSERPIAPNDTETNRAKNRRVEMEVTKL